MFRIHVTWSALCSNLSGLATAGLGAQAPAELPSRTTLAKPGGLTPMPYTLGWFLAKMPLLWHTLLQPFMISFAAAEQNLHANV